MCCCDSWASQLCHTRHDRTNATKHSNDATERIVTTMDAKAEMTGNDGIDGIVYVICQLSLASIQITIRTECECVYYPIGSARNHRTIHVHWRMLMGDMRDAGLDGTLNPSNVGHSVYIETRGVRKVAWVGIRRDSALSSRIHQLQLHHKLASACANLVAFKCSSNAKVHHQSVCIVDHRQR